MHYHVLMHIGEHYYQWNNLDYDGMVSGVLVPFINKQVVPIAFSSGGVRLGKAILNLASVNSIRIFKTVEPLSDKPIPISQQLISPDFAQNDCTTEIIEQFLVSKSPKESKSLLEKVFLPTKAQVFIIMKFGNKILDSAYEGAMKPIIKNWVVVEK